MTGNFLDECLEFEFAVSIRENDSWAAESTEFVDSLGEVFVKFRLYDLAYGPINVEAELDQMLQSGNSGAEEAAARFCLAMTEMERDGRSYGSTVPYGVINGHSFAPQAALKTRACNGYQLYFSFIKRPIAPSGEVRVLLAAADLTPAPGSAGESAKRHNTM